MALLVARSWQKWLAVTETTACGVDQSAFGKYPIIRKRKIQKRAHAFVMLWGTNASKIRRERACAEHYSRNRLHIYNFLEYLLPKLLIRFGRSLKPDTLREDGGGGKIGGDSFLAWTENRALSWYFVGNRQWKWSWTIKWTALKDSLAGDFNQVSMVRAIKSY